MYNPQVCWDEGDMVVIDLTGKGDWLKPGEEFNNPKATWWVDQDTAEKLLKALIEFFHPELPTEEPF